MLRHDGAHRYAHNRRSGGATLRRRPSEGPSFHVWGHPEQSYDECGGAAADEGDSGARDRGASAYRAAAR